MPLIVVPTPIGNLEDITLRALRTLREADIIACEDTRRTLKLLNRYAIAKTLVSYHRHNEMQRTEELLAHLRADRTVALVSDAGTPGISDPGYILIKRALDEQLPVDALPGPNAVLPALLLSGLPPQPFVFMGFAEGSEKERTQALQACVEIASTLVFYVSPHGLARTLEFYARHLGDRPAALVREISKIHQETIRAPLQQLAEIARTRELKGEMVLVTEGAPPRAALGDDAWQELAAAMRAEGIFDKEIANTLFARYGIPRNIVKRFLLGP